MASGADLFQPSGSDSSVTKISHHPAATWRTYLFFHLAIRLGIFLRELRRKPIQAGDLHPLGPQDFSDLLEISQTGKSWYDVKHGVQVDWFLLPDQAEFSAEKESDQADQLFDWSHARVLRFQPSPRGGTVVKRTVFFFNGGGYVEKALPVHGFICSNLAHQLEARVLLFPYQLAPTGIAASELPKIVAFYLAVANQARQDGHEIIVAGDR